MKDIRPALAILILMTLLLGLVYPSSIWFAGNVFFQDKAKGSLIYDKGRLIGSKLIGQQFAQDKYFWSRPALPAQTPYIFLGSVASNLNPANPVLIDTIKKRIELLATSDNRSSPVPSDLVTASASGLDPHISHDAALYQVSRIAKTRGIDETALRSLIDRHVIGRTLIILGEPRINVLELNLALDLMGDTLP